MGAAAGHCLPPIRWGSSCVAHELLTIAPLVYVCDMSTLRGHEARITIAVGTLSKMLSTIDSSSLTPIDTEMTPQMQLRAVLRRKSVITAVKRGIENALGILKLRYNAMMSFVQSQENREELQQEADRFWNEQQGEKFIEDAQLLIIALDAQLLMDESLHNLLSQQSSDEVANATAALSISDTASPQEDQPTSERQNPNQDTLSFTPNQDVPSSLLQPIQLRRLELPTFDGDVTQFYDFWCRFKTAIHDNASLSLSTKFIYLTNSLKGSAALIVRGYDPSKPENYQLAVQALRRRYDRPKFTHNLFHQRLEQLPTSSNSASAQRDTLSQVQSFILQLNRYEDTTTSLALMKTIMKKFPRDTQLEVHKLEHRSGKTWTLPELIDGLNEVIEELEKLEDYAIATSGSQLTTNIMSVNSSRSPTPEPRYDPSMCCFCNSYNHTSTRCHHYIPPHNRRIIVSSLQLCWKCFRPDHPSRLCNRGPCSRCGGDHHYLVCVHTGRRSRPFETGRRRYTRESSDSRSHSRGRHHGRSPSHGRRVLRSPSRGSSYSPRRTYSRTPSPHNETSHRSRTSEHRTVRFRSPLRDQSSYNSSPVARNRAQRQESPVYAALDSDEEYEQLMRVYRDRNSPTTQLSTTLDTSTISSLMSVKASAVNPKANSTMSVTLLLDTGAQRSFVLQDTIDKLQITVSEKTPLTTVAFGGIRTIEHSGIVNVTLVDKQNKQLRLIEFSRTSRYMSIEQDPMKRSAKPISSDDKTQKPLPAKQSKSTSTVGIPSGQSTKDTDLLATILELQQTTHCIPEGRSYRPLQHPALIQSGSKSPPRRPSRDRTPLELISELAKGNYNPEDISYEDDDNSEDRSVPLSQRLSLRIAQSLTLAANYDHTFSVEQLATRDYVMIDAFLRHNIYDGYREAIAEAAYTPTPADLNYPPVKNHYLYGTAYSIIYFYYDYCAFLYSTAGNRFGCATTFTVCLNTFLFSGLQNDKDDRAIAAVSDGKCLYCLKTHSPGYCRRDIPCRLCDSTEHHPALCPYSHYLVRDIGPDVNKFFGAMYVLYENHHRHH
ncbi:hypothetical protein TELCIR_18022 [Teladorsagia circumcincta]|uniref:Peptidase A2 domain-containing protein n=1 Tax=Teladorsagia circumcincta TaxID=45464 RepID=A0A2G9TT83_TELCI|nr:hypothetical protein TELCIR_18022 [Teladorsagia circumcincta]